MDRTKPGSTPSHGGVLTCRVTGRRWCTYTKAATNRPRVTPSLPAGHGSMARETSQEDMHGFHFAIGRGRLASTAERQAPLVEGGCLRDVVEWCAEEARVELV
ncbi:hypothetical protein NDU88_000758 [Pleurodeles waltl]|uniref:Uncharacterized protein n=1 Tax=Pleurodeles waltl TaxID=8319 RepID=A0AAV7R888_PLEWA|nr:hypothetical protein NDU88_000758 [Pleurodeles waltl]